jgi:hypothetical protein
VKKYLDYAISVAVFVAALVYYWLQVCPSFYFWDSAELAAAVASSGLPHPPGFPLYLILAKLFCTVVPMDIGKASSLFSAVCGATSIALFYLVLLKLFKKDKLNNGLSRVLALGGSVGLAVSASLTAQSTRGEVYSLNLLLFIIALYFMSDLIMSHDGVKSRSFMVSCLFLGLGLANHHLTLILVLPGLLYLALNEKIDYRFISMGLFLYIMPLSLYYYLIILAGNNPDLNWGNPKTIGDLFAIFTGKGFNKPVSAFSIGHIWENYSFDISLLYRQLGPIIGLFSVVGIITGWAKSKKLIVFILICLIFNLLSTVFNEMYYYENTDLHGYLLISLVCLIILAIYGIKNLALRIKTRYTGILIAAILGISILVPAYANRGWADLSGNTAAPILATAIIDECQQNALVITSSYNSYFIIKAMQNVYGKRKDLLVVNVYLLGQKWYRELIANRCKLQQINLGITDIRMFYKDLVNVYKDSSEIYIEYDDQSAPLRNYLLPAGLFMKFNNQPSDWSKIDKVGFVVTDLGQFENFVHPGMDYELLKSVMLILDGRYKYFKAIGQPDLADKYLAEIDKIAEISQR